MPATPDEILRFAGKIRRWAETNADPEMRRQMEALAADMEAIAARRQQKQDGE